MSEPVEEAKPPLACDVCERLFKYGEFMIETKERKKILCENCTKKGNESGTAVLYGGGQISIVARDRALRNLKKLERMSKNAKKRKG